LLLLRAGVVGRLRAGLVGRRAPAADMKKGPAGPLHDAGVDAGRCYEVGVSIEWILRARDRAQMNVTPPGANTEYSRGTGPSRPARTGSGRGYSASRDGARAEPSAARGGGRAEPSAARSGGRAEPSAARSGGRAELSRGIRAGVLAATLLGSLLLVVAEFTTLFTVHVETSSAPIKTVTTGSHHSYALIPIAVLAAALAIGVFRDGSRPALLAIGLLGIVTLLIALLGDLPDANATGLAGSSSTQLVNASSTPSAGLYLETLGAVVFVITCGVALMARAPSAGRPGPQAGGGDPSRSERAGDPAQ
jgi:hypothetical protein